MNFNTVVPGCGSSALRQSAALSTSQHRKLVEAAQQFEGMLLEEMLKPMKMNGFGQEDGTSNDEDKDGGLGLGDTLSSFGTEAMATAIARAGGLGIAKRVVEQVETETVSRNTPSARIATDSIIRSA
jgi:peptidoglycan hydrolase FlgJ